MMCVCWLLNIPAMFLILMCLRGGSAQTILHCHTEVQVADQTFHLIQSQYTDTKLTSPITDPEKPGAWQGTTVATGVPVFKLLE